MRQESPYNKPNDKDQNNFTNPESNIMKTSNGFDQCYNGQAAVNDDMVIVGASATHMPMTKRNSSRSLNLYPKNY
jgi:hypothetical protein